MTSSIEQAIEQAVAAWNKLEEACTRLLSAQCNTHRPYMPCPMDCRDVENALGEEFTAAQPLVTAALLELRRQALISAHLPDIARKLRYLARDYPGDKETRKLVAIIENRLNPARKAAD